VLGALLVSHRCAPKTDNYAYVLLATQSHFPQAAIRAKWDAKNNGSLIDALNEEFGAFSKSVKKVFIAQVCI
jgi:hypothetical protein